MAKTDWFAEARFGMFIHWGLYAIPARGEWVRGTERMTPGEYQVYFDAFDPVDYDPKIWAKAAKDAGMKYAVLTAKHHDGFCLFDSKYTGFKATNTKTGRDLVREYLDAFRAEGLKVGLYYSLIDWNHPDYPHYGDQFHPMRENGAFKDAEHDFDRYLTYMHGQVEELCTNYGKIDIFWFDFSYGDMTGEKWKATELVRMIRKHLPDVLLDNRLEVSGMGFGSLLSGTPSEYSGDFVSPEQLLPPDGIRDVNGKPVLWEACVTMNNNWGYCQTDRNFKPAGMIIKKLVECVSKGGNMLLNVGPDAKGSIPRESLGILREIGVWMRQNGESIYGCNHAEMAKPEYGRITRRGDILYVHIFESQIGAIPLAGLTPGQIKRMWLVATGTEIKRSNQWFVGNYPEIPFISFGDSPCLPDPADTVVGVELHGEKG
jgi:alpha-L-fucosidase